MLGPHIDVRALVPRGRISDSPAYELELVTPAGELVLVASYEGRGGCNTYSDPRVARVLGQQALRDFPGADALNALDMLCSALVRGSETYAEAVAKWKSFRKIELQILALGLEAYGLPFVVDGADRCVLALGDGTDVRARPLPSGDIAATWSGGRVQGTLDAVAAAVRHCCWGAAS